MNKKERAKLAVELLKEEFPDAVCSLTYEKPHELLIAVRLSAQCTDARVNMVTPVLFSKYPTIEALSQADKSDVREIIKSCGLSNTKASDVVEIAKSLLENYDKVVPDTIEELLKLPGVGRKTANLVVGDIYGKPAVVCDTHCIRITNHLGLTTTKDPLKTEKELRACLPMKESNGFCHRLVLHGRKTCVARNPKCSICCLKEICKTGLKKAKEEAKDK